MRPADVVVSRFGTGTVEVWRVPVEASPGGLEILSDDERARAARLRRQADRDRFVTAWVALRHVLAERLGARPADLRFRRTCRSCGRDGHGKPALVESEGWEFSLSHTGGNVLLAISDAGRVGVDIEATGEHLAAVAHLVRAPQERAESPDEVLRLWVCKEAVLKATGDGLSVPMSSFSVTPFTWPSDPTVATRMALAELEVPDGHRAAVAVLPDRPSGNLSFGRPARIG